ncbi:MAG: exonuclease III [Methanomassiliicoccales archaeon PtaU1.Bin124]|nr:MAG: exonuclease III [Methanomassiliicoccales archaeon PtaU1.Bin124]
MKLLCWNVNGVRAAYNKGLLRWIEDEKADVYCLQETKASKEQVPKGLCDLPGYSSHFVSNEGKGGYSGVGLITKKEPNKIVDGLGIDRFDREGRSIVAHYDDFVLYNVYFPNGKASAERLRFKMDFYEQFLAIVNEMKKHKGVVICGDVNTAHKEIDLARPKENSKISGFLPEERGWMDSLVASGFVDTYRHFDPSPERYSWWDLKTGARQRNVGWRIDYFLISDDLLPKLRSAFIQKDVMGSDHCPVGIELDVE